MINDLRYAVSFPTNGIALNGAYSFQPGATTVSGRNGTGKSFIAEMIRYGMFGKKALRGPASDYKSLDMELGFLDYRVKRGKKEELIDPDGEVIAVGADAVNKKIIEILGFDLEVFDVVCSANQKESERLTRLTPARRKELIDDVVGLTAQEAVEKACREETKGLTREAEALTRALVLPQKPEKPKGYRASAKIGKELVETRVVVEKRAELQRTIAAVGEKPQEPVLPAPNIDELEAHERTRVTVEANRKSLREQIAAIPDPKHTAELLEAAAELIAYEKELARRGAKPTVPLDVLDEMETQWARLGVLKDMKGEVQCPECDHSFVPAETVDATDEPDLTTAIIRAERQAHDRWADELVEPKGERLTEAEIVAGKRALDRVDQKVELQKSLDALPEMPDRAAKLAEARRLDREWDIYERDSTEWTIQADAATQAELDLAELPEPKHTLEDLNEALTAARVYESQLERYQADKQRFDELTTEIAEKQERADAFTAGAKGLVEARRTLKAFLAPSLSRVASANISQMTVAAERPLSVVHVDEDMSITVDGQDCSTFNGAHATMINLALRMALGQVLVSRVMPLFIGDEIDSDLDEDNAQALADALLELKDQLKQVIIISHKRLENFDEEIVL